MRVDGDHRQAEIRIQRGQRQARGRDAKPHHEARRGGGEEGEAENPQAAHLQQPGQGGGRAGRPVLDDHLIVGDQPKTAIEQPQQQIGFAGTGRAGEQNRVITIRARPGGARGVQTHGRNVASF